jgi:hypothetical protein
VPRDAPRKVSGAARQIEDQTMAALNKRSNPIDVFRKGVLAGDEVTDRPPDSLV